MFYLVRNNRLNTYFTINRKERTSFLILIDDLEEKDKEFEIIYDSYELKHILNNYFLSKSRGEKYNEFYTSVTKVTSSLFPIDIKRSKGLINWYKNISIENYIKQQEINEKSMDIGTELHLCIEEILKNDYNLAPEYIIEELNIENKEECKKAILNYKKYKYKIKKDEEYNSWFDLEYDKINCLHSELFLKDDDLQIQGTVDNLWIFDNELTLQDIKTTSKEKEGKPVFKSPSELASYHRQLAIYSYLLTKHKYITKEELKKLKFRIDMFHWKKEEYRVYDFENKYILGLIKPTMKVLEWVNSNK